MEGTAEPVDRPALRRPGWLTRFLAELNSLSPEHDRLIRLIILERLVKSSILTVLALGVLVVGRTGQITRWTQVVHDQLNLNAGDNLIVEWLERLLQAIGVYRHLTALALGLIAYSALEATEGIGLARRKRWAEYLTVLATSLLIPYEIFEVVRHVTLFKVGALILNLAIVCYLTYRKRLFVDV